MKSFIFKFIILFMGLSSSAFAVESDKEKLNYILLTDDYGILHPRKKSTMPKTTKHPKVKLDGASGAVYWQCFKRDDVVLNLIDLGYSSDEKGWNENYGDV